MDIPVVQGVVLCPLCHQPMTVQRSYGVQLRQAYCTNRACHSYLLAGPIPQEVTLYTAPRAGGPRPT